MDISPLKWARIMLEEGFPPDAKIIAEGLGIIFKESGFDSDPGGDGAHFGAWQEESSFGTVEQRLDPHHATRAARERWEADNRSFYPAWGRWQLEQSGENGATLWPKYMPTANRAVREFGATGSRVASAGGPGRGGENLVAIEGSGGIVSDEQRSGLLKALVWAVLIIGGASLAGLGISRGLGAEGGTV
jgi:hypothetical protein